MEENEMAGIQGTAPETGTQEPQEPELNPVEQAAPVEKMFTKAQINEIMKKRVERSHNAFFTRYGVKDLNELDALFGKSKDYDSTKEQFDTLTGQYDNLTGKYNELEASYKDLNKKYAFKSGNINPEKYSDIETYFKGKNLDIDEHTLLEELKAHPDWIAKAAKVTSIGAEAAPQKGLDEIAQAEKYFGVSLR